MRPHSTIHIIGAGIGGLTLAKCLKNKGIQAIVFEKNPSPAQHSYGISLQTKTCQALMKVLGINEPTFWKRVAVDGSIGGRGLIMSKDIREAAAEYGVRTHRGRVEGLLRESLDIRWGHVLENVSNNGAKHILKFRGKDDIRSDFLVDTSGAHSPVRRSLLPGVQQTILPYVVFRGTRHIDGSTFKELYKPKFEGGSIIEMRDGNNLLQISTNDVRERGDGVNISYIYSRQARQDDQLHRPERTLQESEQPFKDAFDVEKMRRDRILHWLMTDILVPLGDLKILAEKGVIAIGDAVHATPILGGEGANSAIADAVELAKWILSQVVDDISGFYDNIYGVWGNIPFDLVALGVVRVRGAKLSFNIP
ncbi:FAD/NAD(P)-binding domain-containing protein [Hyaloscypha hepaticicola]|uniref:FAD/NAD(P)-binding domain-containing protein n=1 Tax=Hyaloscypha hepaticicola TaxID=2082293 RepID=A0A2J6QFS2_9HELO|nr:FAD/NAD(P)-binding domain-containing protein [Hyaloscypha hepaticicola]